MGDVNCLQDSLIAKCEDGKVKKEGLRLLGVGRSDTTNFLSIVTFRASLGLFFIVFC